MSTVATPDLESLKYPTGRLSLSESPSPKDLIGWIAELAALPEKMRVATSGLSDSQLDTPYRPGGWTVRQVVHHVPDSHMNAYLRVHWTLTEERPTIKPYDQDAWAALPYARTAPIAASLDLLEALHARWVVVWRNLSPDQLLRQYFHPEDQRFFTLTDLLQIYAWHTRHHLAHITTLRARNGWK
jgi:hypothetical protein